LFSIQFFLHFNRYYFLNNLKVPPPFSWMAIWATSGSLLRRARVTAAFCWTRSQAAPSDGLGEVGFSPSSSSSRSIPKRHAVGIRNEGKMKMNPDARKGHGLKKAAWNTQRNQNTQSYTRLRHNKVLITRLRKGLEVKCSEKRFKTTRFKEKHRRFRWLHIILQKCFGTLR